MEEKRADALEMAAQEAQGREKEKKSAPGKSKVKYQISFYIFWIIAIFITTAAGLIIYKHGWQKRSVPF